MDPAAPEPDPPQDRPAWPRMAWMTLRTFLDHQMTDAAAALTYYAMLSLFPALLMAVSLLSLAGSSDLPLQAANYLSDHGASRGVVTSLRDVLDNMINTSSGKSGITFLFALLLALNGASGAYGAAGRALNRVNGVEEDRPFVRRKLTDLAATLVVMLLFLAVLVALFLGGGIADDLFGKIGLGSSAAAVWAVLRWPLAIVLALLAYGVVYAYAPDVEPRKLRWVSPGAVVAVVIWVLGSIGFSIFLKAVPGYGAAYGAFTAAILLLLWLYLTTNAFLYGAELNATLRRVEVMAGSGPPFVTPPPVAASSPPATSTSLPAPDR